MRSNIHKAVAKAKFGDLHLHTLFSDGTYTPEELVKKSAKVGLSAISVVDHDTIDGILPAVMAARAEGIEVIPGIELSSDYEGLEVHILGYCFDPESNDLKSKLALLRQNRIERVYKMVDKLKGLGIKLEAQAVFDIGGEGTVGRLHIARAMVNDGVVRSTAEAFQKYIGDKCPAYVCGFRFSPLEAIKLIRDIGGVAVLAHPYLLRSDELIRQFVGFGIMGLEVYYPEHTQSMINLYLELAKEYNLLVTGGSDCHGKAKPDVKIGLVRLPYRLVEKLKAASRGG